MGAFEEKKFVKIQRLMDRWDCSKDLIYDLVSQGKLQLWHHDGQTGQRGMRIVVDSVLAIEQQGYLQVSIGSIPP